jgi:cytochrome P450
VQAFFLALALYPEVQKKAQAEIDTVIGPNRLPDVEDRPSLPYINAILKESMRWHLVLPLGGPFFIIMDAITLTSSQAIPHVATNDDEYDGYYIPKGTVLIGNAWSVRTMNLTFCPDFLD